MISTEQFVELVERENWHIIINETDGLRTESGPEPRNFFFRGVALMSIGQSAEAVATILEGLKLNPTSDWGNKILFDARLSAGDVDQAFTEFRQFILTPGDREQHKAWYVECAAQRGLFDIASEMNERRQVIAGVREPAQYAIAVQCFCKPDTLALLFESLIHLEGVTSVTLVIIQDNIHESKNPARYAQGYMAVRELLNAWRSRLSERFYSVEYLHNERNLGTAPTCRRLLDDVARKYDGFLFVEDDCILSPQAWNWTSHHLSNSISVAGTWFVSCESSFFDRRDLPLPEGLMPRLKEIASRDQFRNSYITLDFVPSTCFATRSDIWRKCANYRSFTRGPESLNKYVEMQGKRTISPVVPYASDIGMLHELGYSVANVGAANVRELKGTYLLAQSVFQPDNCSHFTGDLGLLFRATSELDEASLSELERGLSIGSSSE